MPSGKKKRASVRERPRQARKTDDDAALTSWARSLGAAAGFVRRLVTRDKPTGTASLDERPRESGALWDRAAAPFKRSRSKDRLGVNAELLSQQRSLKEAIRKLEAELDQLHANISTGVGPPNAGSEATTSALDAWILRSRELREHLQDKRSELARLQRAMAREERLSSKDAPRTNRPAPDEHRSSLEDATESFVTPVRGERRSALIKAMKALMLSLQEHTARRAVKRTARSLLDGDPDVRREAVTLLGSMDSPALFDVLLITAEDPSEKVRLATLNALAGLHNVAAAKVFRRFLGAGSPPLRLAALRGLASLDASRLHSSELVAAIEDDDVAVRKAAAAILGWQQTEGAVSQRVLRSLTFALTDEAEGVRLAATEALGAIGGQRAVFSLMRTIADPSDEVRVAGWRALRATAGAEVDEIGAELAAEDRVEALRSWWKEARVRGVTPSTEVAPLDEPVVRRAPAARAEPQPRREPSMPPVAAESPVEVEPSVPPAAAPSPPSVAPEPVAAGNGQLPPSERSEPPAALDEPSELDAELPGPDASLIGEEQAEDTSIFESEGEGEGEGDFENVMFGDDEGDADAADMLPVSDDAGPDDVGPDVGKPAEAKKEAAPEAAASEEAPKEEKKSAEPTDEAASKETDEKAAASTDGDVNGTDDIAIPGPGDAMDFGLDAEEQEGGEQFESLFGDGEESDEDASGEGGFESIMGDVADSGE